MIRVAFASDRNARSALAALRTRPDLYLSAELRQDAASSGDLALVDITARHDTRAQVITLTQGMHGVVVRIGARLVQGGGTRDPVDPIGYH